MQAAAVFSTSAPAVNDADSKHKQKHLASTVHPQFYEDLFSSTAIRELEYVRSPFYDLGRAEHLKEGEDAQQFLTNVQLKLGMTQFLMGQL